VLKTCSFVIAAIVPVALLASGSVWSQDSKPAAVEVKRNILDHYAQSGVDGKEIVVGTAEFPKGGVIGYHTHPGDEVGYVLKGSFILKVQGQPDRPLKAGDHFFNPRGSVHSLIAAPDGDGGTSYSTWIVDKGQPMATPVKQ
jgi:quercetin dioxygenase-like cupin family protein